MIIEHTAWLAASAAVIGALVQVLKSDAVYSKLPIAKSRLPWIALGLGVVSAIIRVYLNPDSNAQQVVELVLEGVLSGMAPIAVHELGSGASGS